MWQKEVVIQIELFIQVMTIDDPTNINHVQVPLFMIIAIWFL